MTGGLYSREAVAKFLGKRVPDVERMIEEDGLPAVPIPNGTAAPRHKFSAQHLCGWLNKRSKGRAWSVDDVRDELDRCSRESVTDDASCKPTLQKVSELGGLCVAAEIQLKAGRACPHLVRSICEVAQELEGAAKS